MATRTALLLVAHGSRRAASNEEVRQLAAALAAQAGTRYHQVRCAFLELAEPSIPDGLRQCIAGGAEAVRVVPYFLAAGRHVVEDIPAEMAPVIAAHPEVQVTLTPHLGAAAGIAPLLLDLAAE